MRKSCFLKSVIILTILVGALVYIIKYKLEDWVVKPGKEFIVKEAIENLDTELIHVTNSANKDSLKNLVKYFFKNVKSFEEVVNLEEEKLFKEFKVVIADSTITDSEISNITSILKKVEYEKSKGN